MHFVTARCSSNLCVLEQLSNRRTIDDDSQTNSASQSNSNCFSPRAQLIDGWWSGARAGEINNATSECVHRANLPTTAFRANGDVAKSRTANMQKN